MRARMNIYEHASLRMNIIIVIAQQPASQSSPALQKYSVLMHFSVSFPNFGSQFLNSLIMHAENKKIAWCAQNSVRIQSVESDSANGSIYCIISNLSFARSLVTCIAPTLGNAQK